MQKSNDEIRKAVKTHYATAITQKTSCCDRVPADIDPGIQKKYQKLTGYSDQELEGLPEGVTSFGCGNPVNFTDLKPGQVVLDLGSGAGLDLILAARKVGETGKAIGLDMTPEMIETCNRNIAAAGLKNAEVRQGEMENMPISKGTVDWIISNCVINLSPEKERVFSEAFRVLKPGGRMLISDIVTNDMPQKLVDNMVAWCACLAGAVEEQKYTDLVKKAGFINVKTVDKFVYDSDSLGTMANEACCGEGEDFCTVDEASLKSYAGKVASIKLSATKPS